MALKFFNEIEQKQESLDNKVKQLEEKITLLTSCVANSTAVITTQSPETSLTNTNDAVVTQPVAPKKPLASNKTSETPPKDLNPDRRFNVVVYGIKESPPNTSRYNRSQNDLKELNEALPDIDLASIKDFFRLGKFKTGQIRPRPILLKFLRVLDVTSLLSDRGKFNPPIVVKPDVTPKERNIESLLLRERWNLIQNGTDCKVIKIYNHLLYVNKKLHGEVKDSKFHYINSSYIQDVDMSVQENSIVTTPPANPSTSGVPSDHSN